MNRFYIKKNLLNRKKNKNKKRIKLYYYRFLSLGSIWFYKKAYGLKTREKNGYNESYNRGYRGYKSSVACIC